MAEAWKGGKGSAAWIAVKVELIEEAVALAA
jgi:hypothetical protein